MGFLGLARKKASLHGNSPNDTRTNFTVNRINMDFKQDPSYRRAILTNHDLEEKTVDIRVVNTDKSSIKKHYVRPNMGLKNGEYITYYIDKKETIKATYMVTDFEFNLTSPSGKSKYCNNYLKIDGVIIPCVDSNDAYGKKLNQSTDFIKFTDSKCEVQVQDNKYTIKINPDHRFVMGKKDTDVYKVVDVDTSITEGILTFTMQKDTASPFDDIKNRIAFQGKVEDEIPTEYKIIGNDKIKFNQTETYTIEPSIDCEWSLDDEEVAEIVSNTSNSCVVKGILKDEMVILSAIVGGKVIDSIRLNVER